MNSQYSILYIVMFLYISVILKGNGKEFFSSSGYTNTFSSSDYKNIHKIVSDLYSGTLNLNSLDVKGTTTIEGKTNATSNIRCDRFVCDKKYKFKCCLDQQNGDLRVGGSYYGDYIKSNRTDNVVSWWHWDINKGAVSNPAGINVENTTLRLAHDCGMKYNNSSCKGAWRYKEGGSPSHGNGIRNTTKDAGYSHKHKRMKWQKL